jgi:hypothetical protein
MFAVVYARTRLRRRALSPEFSAGALAVFIPWRVGAEESGAANLLGPPGGAAAAGRTMVRSPAVPSPITLAIFRFGAVAATLSGTGQLGDAPIATAGAAIFKIAHLPLGKSIEASLPHPIYPASIHKKAGKGTIWSR